MYNILRIFHIISLSIFFFNIILDNINYIIKFYLGICSLALWGPAVATVLELAHMVRCCVASHGWGGGCVREGLDNVR